MKYLVGISFILVFSRSILADYTLEDQNQQQIDPVHQQDYEHPQKDQDKRTIFPTTINNYAWAKHTGVNPSGLRYVLGYGPVDLKYVPIVRPIAVKPMYQFRPSKAKWPAKPIVLKPLLPAYQLPNKQTGWKPVYKPPANVPVPPSAPSKPWQQQGWTQDVLHLPVKPAVQFKPSHSVVNLQPAPKPVVPVRPVVPVVPVQPVVPVTPLKPVVPVPVQPAVPVTPLRPVVPFPVTPLRPLLPAPVAPPAPFVPPASIVPASPLFHVTKPNLPVLPLGSVFPSPILQYPSAPAAPIKPGFVNFFTPGDAIPPPSPFKPATVEFHGNPYIFNSQPLPQAPLVPQPPAFPLQPQFVPSLPLPNVQSPGEQHFFQPQLPRENPNVAFEQHDVQTPQSHQQYLQQQAFEQGYQQSYEDQFQIQNLPQQQFSEQNYQQQQVNQFNEGQYLPPFEQINSQQQYQQQQQQQLEQQTHQNLIQPGQTDVQIPLHLPNHPHFRPNEGSFDTFQQNNFQSQNIFTPSIGLEPPFTKRRADEHVAEKKEEKNAGKNKHK